MQNNSYPRAEKASNSLFTEYVKHDRKLIEDSFADFPKGLFVSHEEMVKQFGKYGWT
jgi:hypothetical protein